MFSTSIIIPSYAYTYIKVNFLKNLLIDEASLKKLKKIKDIKEFIEVITPYYPEIDIKNYLIIEIEQALFHVYIKLMGKIMFVSPENMRRFIRSLLLKFEINNIKQIILGLIAGMDMKQKYKRINFLVEDYLDHSDFIKKLLEITSLSEIQLFVKKTIYNKAIREGILYFKNTGEIFVLEAFLDKLYYENLIKSEKIYSKKETEMINLFIKYVVEIYNLRLIYRGIKDNIERKLLSQMLVDEYLFFNKEKIGSLLNLTNIDTFISEIASYLQNKKELKAFFIPIQFKREHIRWSLEGIYQAYYFKKFKMKIDDIEYSTIYSILELIIKKDKEIKFIIMPHIVRIIHENYERLNLLDEDF
ncbi:MAG: V-type ATPase subunit [Candidatus Hodarchaeota archaeon]